MVYCSKCGNQNADDAEFCSKCGASLAGPRVIHENCWQSGTSEKEWDKRCEQECAGGKRVSSIFWGIVVILIGFAILVWVLKESSVVLPEWLESIDFLLIIGIVIAIALVITGIKIIIKKERG